MDSTSSDRDSSSILLGIIDSAMINIVHEDEISRAQDPRPASDNMTGVDETGRQEYRLQSSRGLVSRSLMQERGAYASEHLQRR
ncbi:hypothetical protein PT2222_390021 [Paraburkholderia tropica]